MRGVNKCFLGAYVGNAILVRWSNFIITQLVVTSLFRLMVVLMFFLFFKWDSVGNSERNSKHANKASVLNFIEVPSGLLLDT